MKVALGKVSIPSRSNEVYGSQIVITCLSLDSANQWAPALSKFATVKRVGLRSLDETKKSTVHNRQYVTVYRTYATVAATGTAL
jgi:hypothetical protein